MIPMQNNIEFTVLEEDAQKRLDVLLSEKTALSRSASASLIEEGGVLVNGRKEPKKYKPVRGEIITAILPESKGASITPQNISLDIIYQDSSIAIINKPQGMVVHPAAGNPDGTLVNALLYHCQGRLSSINGVIRPGIVHRIDKNTSGLLIVAKTDSAHNFLAAQIKEHSFTREYEAVLTGGRLKNPTGTVDAPIGRSKYDRKKMCVTEQNSKHAVTHYEVLEELGQYSLVKFRLETGRTHQIRVHSAYIGHPVYGDDVYGKAVKGIEGQCLHAKKIGFIHPATKEYMEFDSELPDYFQAVLKKLRAGN